MYLLQPEQIEALMRRMEFLTVEVGDVPTFKSMAYQDYLTNRNMRRSLERLAENVANTIIDMSKILLSTTDLPVPGTYREAILQLATMGIIEQKLVNRLAQLVRLRNVLAHQYLDIKWPVLRRFIDEAPSMVTEFLEHIDNILENA